MAEVPVEIRGTLYDLQAKTTRQVVLLGKASIYGLGVGGGPIIPPEGGGGDPPHIWGGPIDPRPDHGLPGPQPHPEHPIVLPPNVPPPEGPADDNGFIKPPPEGGGWGYHATYGWLYDPPAGAAQPKK